MPDLPARFPSPTPLNRRWLYAAILVLVVVVVVVTVDTGNWWLPALFSLNLAVHLLLARYRADPHTRIDADEVHVCEGRKKQRTVATSAVATVDRASPYSPVHVTLRDGETLVLAGTQPEDVDTIRTLLQR